MAEVIDILLNAKMNVSDVSRGVGDIQSQLKKLTLPSNISSDLEKSFSKLTPLIKDYQKQLDKGFSSQKDLKNFNLLQTKIDAVFKEITNDINSVNSKEVKIKTDIQSLEKLETKLKATENTLEKAFSNLFSGTKTSTGIQSQIEKLQEGFSKTTVLSKFSDVHKMVGELSNLFQAQEFTKFNGQIEQIREKIAALNSEAKLDLAHKLGLNETITSAKKAEDYIIKLFNAITVNKDAAANIDNTRQKITELKAAIEQTKIDNVANGAKALSGASAEIEAMRQAMLGVGQSTNEATGSLVAMHDQMKQLQSSTQYFFSLRNMLNLLKRGIKEAVQTVKELDAAMTETAVVTKFSVTDMWAKLPEYTANANALGATIQDMYESTTLYYQQGLNTQQAMEIATETMKMARIAGLEAADATDMMTAALRGFNMEINEASAQRINDVYSNLAAKTASNTEELGTAMQRTASIAASAGMSFEGTAAFLAQAIETTREPAENLGTAMKTIVARFTELKKNPFEIVEVDGEEVSFNKVDTALQSIGVSLKDTNGQFRDLDKVFLDISQKWDSLTQTQQRYIATTAAGSRQQSRFIAMMSNYSRTVELMQYANNANGASNEQFGKTLDSLEAKINQFQNAWKKFLMGIMNDTWTKRLVDGGTKVLNIVNAIIDKLSGNGKLGLLKSGLSIFTAFKALQFSGKLLNKGIGGIAGMLDPASSFGVGWRAGGIKQTNAAGQAKAIYEPIVLAVNRIYGTLTGKAATGTTNNNQADKKAFETASNQVNGLLGYGKGGLKGLSTVPDKVYLSNLNDIFQSNSLNDRQRQAILQQLPGLTGQLGTEILFDSKGLSKEATEVGNSIAKDIQAAIASKQMSPSDAIQILGDKQKLKQTFGDFYSDAILDEITGGRSITKRQLYEELFNQYKIEGKSPQKAAADAKRAAGYTGKLGAEEDKEIIEGTSKGFAVANTQASQLANKIGQLGTIFTSSGQAIAQFGTTLSNLGLKGVGDLITNLGYKVSSLGMIFSGVATTIFTLQKMAITAGAASVPQYLIGLIKANPMIVAVTGTLLALGTAIVLVSKRIKSIKEAGEQVSKTFEETNKSTQENIAKLKSYRNELATLSKGVDKNGNNINLSDSDYERYLEIVDDIAQINPKIVEGYNAQGHAIINNNEALEETLKLQEQIQEKAVKDYTSTASLQKLITARNVNKDFKSVANRTVGATFLGVNGTTSIKTAPLYQNVQKVAQELKKARGTWFDESQLEIFGIHSLDALLSGEESAVNAFVKHQTEINEQLSNVAASTGNNFTDALTESFETLGEKTDLFNEAIEPIFQNLAVQASEMDVFDNIKEEFKTFVTSGLKDIASKDWDANKMANETKRLVIQFADLSSESSKYSKVMDEVVEAQDNFASTLDETQYTADVQPAISELNRLKAEALSSGTVYGDALAEYLENQIQRISKFTTEGSINLTSALDTATDDIAKAEAALDSFNEATATDYWTAAEGMKSIYDSALETYKDSFEDEYEKHFEGSGDKTAWTAGRALFGEETLQGIDIDGLRTMFDKWGPALREGEEGWYHFWHNIVDDPTLLENLNQIDGVHWDEDDFYIPEDKWSEVAKTIGISEDMLTSMLNKGRQFAEISFTNWEDVRKAIATSDFSIAGTGATEGQEQKVYLKKETWENALAEANFTPEQYYSKENEKNRKEQNIELLDINSSAKKLQKQFDDMGAKTLPDLIKTLSQTGDFTKDEIQKYAEKLDYINDLNYDEVYEDTISRLENPELAKQTDTLTTIEGYTAAINSYLGKQEIRKGYLENPMAEAGYNLLVGNKNDAADTKYEQFARGYNADGSLLTDAQYQATSAELDALVNGWQEHLSDVQTGLEEARTRGDELQIARLEEEEQGIQTNIDLAQEFQKRAENSLKKLEQNKELRDKSKNEGKEKTNNLEQPQSNQRIIRDTPSGGRPTTESVPSGGTAIRTYHAELDKGDLEKEEAALQRKERKLEFQGTVNPKSAEQELKALEKPRTTPIEADTQPASSKYKIFHDYVDSFKPVVTVDANTSPADRKIQQVRSIPSTYLTIWPDFKGTWEKTIVIKKETRTAKGGGSAPGNNETVDKAIGQNNHGYASSPTFNSAARGYGQVGPKGKGGLTLTGELGYEIAWLPSENRSMILGANGPQMINLPSDAVVWTHEQSKKIVKQKAIPAGSHSLKSKGTYKSTRYDQQDTGIELAGKDEKASTTPSRPTIPKEITKEIEKVTEKAGKVTVWWENMARLVETNQRRVDKNQKTFENKLKDFDTTSKNIKGIVNTYQKNLKQSIRLGQLEVKKANKELVALDKNKKYSKTKISYEVTKTTKDSKGKVKKTKETKETNVNLSNFIKKRNGTYLIDQKQISKIAKRNKSKAEAIKDAAEKEINDRLSKRNAAQDRINEAREALKQLADDVYTTFYQWENSLNKVYFLSEKLNDLSNQMSYQEGMESLLSSKALAGYGSSIEGLSKVLEQQKDLFVREVRTNVANVEAAEAAYQEALNYGTYVKKYKNAPDSEKAQNDLKAAKWALKFVQSNGNFNSSTIASLQKQGYTEETINRIKEIVEDIYQKRSDAENASIDALASVKVIYDKLDEYQSYISDFESDLLSGLEEQTEEEIKHLDKLNSSLSKAYKDLLDEVKRNLDERRKQEDNRKTEADIAKKQQRLATLRADTSGGHQVEIAQLEKEITDAQQNYQRTLEDQLIEKLQNQGDEAEKQRQHQIELLTAQNEIAQNTGTNLAEVQQWLKDWHNNPDDMQTYEKIRNAWLANKGYDKVTENEKINLEQEFDEAFMKYGAYTEAAEQLKTAIESNDFLKDIRKDVNQLYHQIISAKSSGTGWNTFKSAGGTASQAKDLGASATALKKAGYTNKQIFNAGYSKKELKEAGITVKKLKEENIKAKALKSRGYKASTLYKAGYTLKELANAGYDYKTLIKLGFKDKDFKEQVSASTAKTIGMPEKKIVELYGNKKALAAGVSGAVVQKVNGTNVATVQKFINTDKKDNAKQTSLSGMKTKLDINGKKKEGGNIKATVDNTGKTITGNKGSNLYTQNVNTKTGQATGKTTKTTVGKLTKENFTQNKKEATEALVYAIQHRTVGSKINEKMKNLVSAAGIGGKTYKLSNGVTASLGANGKLYYSDKTGTVQIWDTINGSLEADPYSKKAYLKKAQKNNTVSREYARALIIRRKLDPKGKDGYSKAELKSDKYKVKKFVTGGLANFTGPAWLDGTPSKPELVLNAKDTQNFITLKDVLARAMDNISGVSSTYGDTLYEININVDKIEKDYDVDKVVDKVKKEIVKTSGYRNVTQVRNLR